ncbi:MAG: helix-turn-helix domain-containing protein [Verrucomicrobiae bacterium]|nr:helix-turn-helix domain-containing protein [Verrucomicrobiae bacterium]
MTKRLLEHIQQEVTAVERDEAEPARVWKFVPDGRGGFERRPVVAEQFRQPRADAWNQRQAVEAREKLGPSQDQFARLLSISVRTLHQWKQGRRKPSGAACVLLRVAAQSLEAVLQPV